MATCYDDLSPRDALEQILDRAERQERLTIVREALLNVIPALYRAEFTDVEDDFVPEWIEEAIEVIHVDLGVDLTEET